MLAVKHLREFDLPMERCHRKLSSHEITNFLYAYRVIVLARCVNVSTKQFVARDPTRLVLGCAEKCRDDHVPHESNFLQSFVCQLELFMLLLRREEVTAFENSLSI